MMAVWIKLWICLALIATVHHASVNAALPDTYNVSNANTAKSLDWATATAGKVVVVYYGESLCPDCRRFMDETLAPLFTNGIANLMNLRFVPYGNAKILPSGEIVCQHGAQECEYNQIFGCIVKKYPEQEMWFPYIKCVEDSPTLLMQAALKICLNKTKAKIDLEEVLACASGDEGRQLQLDFAKETDGLQPPHDSVPWVTVNGISLGGHVETLSQFICAASQEHQRPEACFEENRALRAFS